MAQYRLATELSVAASDLQLGQHVADDLVRLELEVRVTLALEGTGACLAQPLLEAVHAEAVFTLVALQWVHQDPVADPALHVFSDCLLVNHSLSVNHVYLNWVCVAQYA